MATGLKKYKDDSHPEWVLDFCNFYEAWALSPKPGGKSMGEGIIIIHPDTGWTLHPELWDDSTIVDGELADDRYLISKSKNFMEPKKRAHDDLPPAGPHLKQIVTHRILGVPQFANKPVWYNPSHGTATASVMMSKRGFPDFDEFPFYSEYGGFVSGVAPLVKVIPYKVSESVILFAHESIDLSKAILYAVTLGKGSAALHTDGSQIGVISISLGGFDTFTKIHLRGALEEARKAGIIVIAAAGQLTKALSWFSEHGDPVYPAIDPNTITAAACNYKHEIYEEGFYGSSVDITAPGEGIWEARSKSTDQTLSDGTLVKGFEEYVVTQSHGTSYPAAIVAGACALWLAHHGRAKLLEEYGCKLLFDLFKKVLKDSCGAKAIPGVRDKRYIEDKQGKLIEWDTTKRGAGVLDAERLLQHDLPPKSEIQKIRGG